jgi:hypothetical protein
MMKVEKVKMSSFRASKLGSSLGKIHVFMFQNVNYSYPGFRVLVQDHFYQVQAQRG